MNRHPDINSASTKREREFVGLTEQVDILDGAVHCYDQTFLRLIM